MDNEKLTIETNDTKTVQQDNELESKETRKKSRPQRTFPQYSIEECLIISKSIAENNSGNPWEPEQVAASISISSKTKNSST